MEQGNARPSPTKERHLPHNSEQPLPDYILTRQKLKG